MDVATIEQFIFRIDPFIGEFLHFSDIWEVCAFQYVLHWPVKVVVQWNRSLENTQSGKGLPIRAPTTFASRLLQRRALSCKRMTLCRLFDICGRSWSRVRFKLYVVDVDNDSS